MICRCRSASWRASKPRSAVQSSEPLRGWSASNRRRWRGRRCDCPSRRHPIGHDCGNRQNDRVFRHCLGRPARRSRTFRNAFVNRSIFSTLLSFLTPLFSSFSSMLIGELASIAALFIKSAFKYSVVFTWHPTSARRRGTRARHSPSSERIAASLAHPRGQLEEILAFP
jgi:hypothetical protein